MDFFLQLKSVSLRLWRRRHPSAQLLLSLKLVGFGKPSWRILPALLGAIRAARVHTNLLELLSLCLLVGKPSWRILPAPLGATRAAHVRTHLLELLSLCLLIGKPYCRLL